MLSSTVVADRNLVLLTGVAAVAAVGAIGQKPAENTVLGVEDRQMTERDDFQIFWRHVVGKFCNLLTVEVIGGRDAFEAHFQIRFERNVQLHCVQNVFGNGPQTHHAHL